MKIHTNKEDLLKGIQIVQNAVSSKNTLPILSHILIEAKKKRNTVDRHRSWDWDLYEGGGGSYRRRGFYGAGPEV